MITDTFTINVHARVIMDMYLIFVATKACKFALFIEPRAFIRE